MLTSSWSHFFTEAYAFMESVERFHPIMKLMMEGTSSEVDSWPTSEEIRREFFKRLRNVFLPGSTSEIWKFFDRENSSGWL